MFSSWILAVISYISIFLTTNVDCVPTAAVKARQFLNAQPGYVPVYIRSGDTPLEDINPDLAEAFGVYDQKHGRVFYGRYVGDKLNHDNKNFREDHKNSDIVIVEQNSADKNEVDSSEHSKEPHHIQKIPRPARR